MPYCANCGVELRSKARFCHKCGQMVVKPKTSAAETKVAVSERVQPATSFVNAMFVFNSDEISDKAPTSYGAYAQGEVLKSISRGLEPFGGWETCPSVMLCCNGDLFERSMLGETPSLIVLSDWMGGRRYGIDVKSLDPYIVKMLKANKSLEFIPYVLGIGPIPSHYALSAHNELKSNRVIGYLGLFTLTDIDIPRLDGLLSLPQNMRIVGRKCIGGMASSDDIREAGLEKG